MIVEVKDAHGNTIYVVENYPNELVKYNIVVGGRKFEVPFTPEFFAEVVRLWPEGLNIWDFFRGEVEESFLDEAIHFFSPWYAKPWVDGGCHYFNLDALGINIWIKAFEKKTEAEWAKVEKEARNFLWGVPHETTFSIVSVQKRREGEFMYLETA